MRGLTGILDDGVLLALGVVVRSFLVEHHELPHAPGIGAIPTSGDLAMGLREKAEEVLVSIVPLV